MAANNEKYEIKFHRKQVFMRLQNFQGTGEDVLKEGALEVRKGLHGHELCWIPVNESDVAFAVTFYLRDLYAFSRTVPYIGGVGTYMMFQLKNGDRLPPLEFHQGGSRELIRSFQGLLEYKRSLQNQNEYIICETSAEVVSQAMESLNLFEGASLDSSLGPSSPGVNVFSQSVHFNSSHSGLTTSSQVWKSAQKGAKEGVRAVGRLVRDLVQGDKMTIRMSEVMVDHEVEKMRQEDMNKQQVELVTRDELGFEVLSKKSSLPNIPRPNVTRGPPLSEMDWQMHLDGLGRVTCHEKILEKIFRGGVDPQMRVAVWKYLLNYHKWELTIEENARLVERKKDEYFAMKYQWRSMFDEQLIRNSVIRDRKLQIDKDVKRTDRNLDFFKDEDGENMRMLFDILMTYTMYNFDLGYVQGMNDILSPILILMENEHDAFWCFAGVMDRMERNFEYDQAGMRQQLQQLSSLTQSLDEALFDHLERAESQNMYFCFRWLLLHFKREFSVADSMRMYEVLWTDIPCQNFHLLVAEAILDGERQIILESRPELTDILKHINDIALKIDVDRCLRVAEAIYRQLRACPDLPDDLIDIFGLNSENPSIVSSSSGRE